MKLPDYIYVDVNVPVPRNIDPDFVPAVRQFLKTDPLKTLDLISALRFYEVDADGKLYEVNSARFYGKEGAERYSMTLTKTIECYAKVFRTEEDDSDFVNIRYSFVFNNGKLDEIRIKENANEI
jgi:hypothetical protein